MVNMLQKIANDIRHWILGSPRIDPTSWKQIDVIQYNDIYIEIMQDMDDPNNYSVSWMQWMPNGFPVREVKQIHGNDKRTSKRSST
jgi:hypothetical protein